MNNNNNINIFLYIVTYLTFNCYKLEIYATGREIKRFKKIYINKQMERNFQIKLKWIIIKNKLQQIILIKKPK